MPIFFKIKKICEIEKKKAFFLNENLNLKESHQYYEQIQGQMAIANITKCYFVTFTEKGLHYQVIHFDEIKWEHTKTVLKHFL